MLLEVRPLGDDLPFGARISGVNWETIADEEVRQQLRNTLRDRGMIVFEDIEQTGKMQVALSAVIGPPKDHPVKTVERVNADEMLGVISIRTGPEATIVEIEGKPLMTWQPWHFDHAYNNELNRAAVLRTEVLASKGGNTGFVDGVQIYKDMDPAIRAKIEDKTIIYTLDLRYPLHRWGLPKTFKQLRGNEAMNEMAKLFPRSLHPAVFTYETGEKVLHMTPYGSRGIEGMEGPEGDAICAEVWEEVERVMKPYYHAWKPTDMLMWDNWRTLHGACGCDPDENRIVHRTTIKGDYGLGRWETEPTHLEPVDAMTM